jgi:hypothetical protein
MFAGLLKVEGVLSTYADVYRSKIWDPSLVLQ